MSAYIVDHSVFDHIIAAIRHDQTFALLAPFKPLGYGEQDLVRLAADLYAMNVEAVAQRYPGAAQLLVWGDNAPYRARVVLPIDNLKLHGEIACLLYQCSEGHVPEKPLFQALEEMHATLAHELVNDRLKGGRSWT